MFCHNDLLHKNIIKDKGNLSSLTAAVSLATNLHFSLFIAFDTVSFIDFEYASYNPRGFDIGNHFDEYAGT